MSIEKTRKLLAAKGAAPVLGAALLFGTAACSEDSAGPNEGATLEDIQNEEENDGLGEGGGDGASEEDIAQAPNDESFVQEGDTEGFFEDQESFINEPVTVSGKIVEVFNANAFVIGEGDQATLVTRPNSDNMVTLEPGQVAQVSGPVGTFVLVDVERDLGVDFGDEEFDLFESGPYIAANDVNLLDEE